MAKSSGLASRRSIHSVAETMARFQAAIRADGGTIFTVIDHAAAAARAGITLRARTVIVFGNPKGGSPLMQKAPTLAIDLPSKALVWQDDDDTVWLTLNSSEYMAGSIYARHGLAVGAEAHRYMDAMLERAIARSTT